MEKITDGLGFDYLKCLLPAADGGGSLSEGSSGSNDGTIGDGNNGSDDLWLSKITATSDGVWDKTRMLAADQKKMECILQTGDGGLLLGGTVDGPVRRRCYQRIARS